MSEIDKKSIKAISKYILLSYNNENDVDNNVNAYNVIKYSYKNIKKLIKKSINDNNNENLLKYDKNQLKTLIKLAIDKLIDKKKLLLEINKETNEEFYLINKKHCLDDNHTDCHENNDTDNDKGNNNNNSNSSSNNPDDHINKKIKSIDNNDNDNDNNNVIKGDVTILLFYAYCPIQMTKQQQDNAINKCKEVLQLNDITGRLRVGREGFNATLTGSYTTSRIFTNFLKSFDKKTFESTDFKYVDNLPINQKLKGLKVWPVTEIVTYGFDTRKAPLEKTGIHLKPKEFHEALLNPNSILIDVRNYNETAIGYFHPPLLDNQKFDEKILNPKMRKSTDFPEWVEKNKSKLKDKQVLMCCTAGVRCERASAYIRNQGIDNVYQLEGGIHRYLDEFNEDGGHWIGKNYTFDKRFSHGAKSAEIVSNCVLCSIPWDRYQAQKKCSKCSLELLVCKSCQRNETKEKFKLLLCELCLEKK